MDIYEKKRAVALEELSAKTKINFPKSARLERAEITVHYIFWRRWKEGPLWAKVIVNRADVKTLVEAAAIRLGSPLSQDFQMTDLAKWNEKPPPWWHPEPTGSVLGGHGSAGAGFLEVLIVENQAEGATVYIQYFSD